MHIQDTIIFMGRSGSGKGTQASLLKEYLLKKYPSIDVFYFDSGKQFRSFIERDGYTSEIMRGILGKGILAPDFITEWLLVDEFVNKLTPKKTLIMDGFPRTMSQIGTLDSAMDYYQRDNIKIINIEVSEDEVRKRIWDRGREDDQNLESINKRLSWYQNNVVPVINFFRKSNRYVVIDIDGEQTKEKIHEDITRMLDEYHSEHKNLQ
jgi:adenylate kinase